VPHNFEHFLIYWATGLAFGLGSRRRLGLLAILLLIFAGCVEFAQLFVPGRHARLSDFLIDAVAMWFGLIGASMFRTARDARASASHSARDFRSCAHQQGANRAEDCQALTPKDAKAEVGKRGACKLWLDES
jgi:hypothetical protein